MHACICAHLRAYVCICVHMCAHVCISVHMQHKLNVLMHAYVCGYLLSSHIRVGMLHESYDQTYALPTLGQHMHARRHAYTRVTTKPMGTHMDRDLNQCASLVNICMLQYICR